MKRPVSPRRILELGDRSTAPVRDQLFGLGALGLSLALMACGDSDGQTDTGSTTSGPGFPTTTGTGATGTGDDTHGETGASCDAPTILERSCGGCHGGAEPVSGLDLVKPNLGARLAGVQSPNCEGSIFADPTNPGASYLYQKIDPNSEPACGESMPPPGIPELTTEELTCIRDWISGLVPGDGGTSCPPREMRVCEDQGNSDWWPDPQGDPSIEMLKICQQPTQLCSADGSEWLECQGTYPSIERCNTPEDENCDGLTPDCSNSDWGFSLTGNRANRLNSVAVDAQGNTIVSGEFEGYIDLGHGPVGSDEPGGQFKNDVFLAKFDRFGTPIWAQTFGDSSNQYSPQVTVDPNSGRIAMIVRLFGGITFGNQSHLQKGSSDFVVAVFDGNGTALWSQLIGGGAKDRAERLTFTPDGSKVIVSGKVGADEDDPVVIPGVGPISPSGLADGIVVAFDADSGGVLWHQLLGGGVTTDAGTPLTGVGEACDPGNGNVYRRCNGCGAQHCQTNGTWGATCGVVKEDDQPMFPCSRTDLICSEEPDSLGECSSGDDDYAFGVTTDAAGDVYVTGRWEGEFEFTGLDGDPTSRKVSSAGGLDIFVSKLSGTTGDVVWSKNFAGTGDDRAYDIAYQPKTGDIIVTGYFSGTVDFGRVTLNAQGGSDDDDIFVASLRAQNGTTVFAHRFGDPNSQFGKTHELGKTTRSLNLAIDSDDDIYLGGSLYDSWEGIVTSQRNSSDEARPNPFYVILGPDGTYKAAATYGGSGSEFAYDLAIDPTNGSILLAGHFFGSRLDIWSQTLLGTSNVADGFIRRLPPR